MASLQNGGGPPGRWGCGIYIFSFSVPKAPFVPFFQHPIHFLLCMIFGGALNFWSGCAQMSNHADGQHSRWPGAPCARYFTVQKALTTLLETQTPRVREMVLHAFCERLQVRCFGSAQGRSFPRAPNRQWARNTASLAGQGHAKCMPLICAVIRAILKLFLQSVVDFCHFPFFFISAF